MAEMVNNRRQLLKGSLRYAAVGAVVVSGGSLAVKRKRLLREGKCINKGICGQCGLFNECGLPRALSVRKSMGGQANG